MRVALVGGVFGRPDWATNPLGAPEVALLHGLAARGHDVTPLSHYSDALTQLDRWDVVHVHHLSWGALTTAVQRAAGLPRPFVFTPHGLWLGAPARRLALRLVARAADATVALSPQELAAGGTGTGVVIPNGIDVGEAPVLRRPPPPPLRLLYVGQLAPVKRVDRALHALAALVPRMPARLTLVYHNDALAGELRCLADALDVSHLVDFRGPVARPHLWQEYLDHHCLILTSDSEALPSVVSEAGLLGLPVAAPRLGGIPSQVADPSWLFPPGAGAQQIADHLLAMFRVPGAAEATALAHRGAAERNFATDAMIRRHEELYARLVQSAARRRRDVVLPAATGVARTVLRCAARRRR